MAVAPPWPVGSAIATPKRTLPRATREANVKVIVMRTRALRLMKHPGRPEDHIAIGFMRDGVAKEPRFDAARDEDPTNQSVFVEQHGAHDVPVPRVVKEDQAIPPALVTVIADAKAIVGDPAAAADRSSVGIGRVEDQVDVTSRAMTSMTPVLATAWTAEVAHADRLRVRKGRGGVRSEMLDHANEPRETKFCGFAGPRANVPVASIRERDAAMEMAIGDLSARNGLVRPIRTTAHGQRDRDQKEPKRARFGSVGGLFGRLHDRTVSTIGSVVEKARLTGPPWRVISRDSVNRRDDNESFGDSAFEQVERGWEQIAQNDFRAARRYAERGLELDTNSPEAHNLMGYVFAAEGQTDRAMSHFRTSLSVDPQYLDAMLNVVDLLIQPLGDLPQALAMIDSALEVCVTADEVADTTLLKVEVLLRSGDMKRAREAVATLTDGPFETPQLTFGVGRARFDVGDVDGAEPMIRKALADGLTNGDTFYYLGMILNAREDLVSATTAFLQSRRADLNAPTVPWTLSTRKFERVVQSVLGKVKPAIAEKLEGALVIVSDLPAQEIVSEGIDPRLIVWIDPAPPDRPLPAVTRMFVYQLNAERMVPSPHELERELIRAVEEEALVAFARPSPRS